MTVSSFCRFFSMYFSFFASPIKCYRNGFIVFQARKHEKAKRKGEKPVPCSQAVSVNPKLYEDGIDADVLPARNFAVGITNFSHSRQTMVLNNVTVSSDFDNIVNLPPCFSTALSLWHYRFGIIVLALSLWHYLFGIIALKCTLKTHFSKHCNILQATRHFNITSYSITYYLRATYAAPHVESSASYRLEDRLRCRATGIGGLGAGAEREFPAVFSASAVTVRRGRRSREPEPSQSPQQLSRPRRSKGAATENSFCRLH